MGSASCYSGKKILRNCYQQQLRSLSYLPTQLLLEILSHTGQQSKFNDQPSSNVEHFLSCTQVRSITFKPKTLLRVLQNVQFILFWFRRSNIYQLVVIISRKRNFFLKLSILQWWMHQFLCKFWLWYETAQWTHFKTLDNNQKLTNVSTSLEITVRIINNTKQNCFSD